MTFDIVVLIAIVLGAGVLFVSEKLPTDLVALLVLGSLVGVDPRPFLVAVTFAASTSFSTPVGYQTNAMVYNPGGYRARDYLRAGAPLNVIFWLISVLLIPKFWPF